MKKLLLILVSLLTISGIYAQDFVISPRASFAEYTGISTDLIAATGTLSKVVKTNREGLYYYNATIDIDTTAAPTGNITLYMEGSDDNTNFYHIDSVVFSESADTIIRLENLSSAQTHTIASYTITEAGTMYNAGTEAGTITGTQIWDTASANGDTATYSLTTANTITDTIATANTQTVAAQTITVAEGGIMWRYIRFRCVGGGASVASELQYIGIKVTDKPKF